MTEENKLLKELVEKLLLDQVGFLCFLSNRTYSYPDSKYKTFAASVLREKIDELESHLALVGNKPTLAKYKEILKQVSVEVKEFKHD